MRIDLHVARDDRREPGNKFANTRNIGGNQLVAAGERRNQLVPVGPR